MKCPVFSMVGQTRAAFKTPNLKKKKEKKCIGLIEKSLVFAALYHIYRPYAGLPLGSIQPFTQ